jgi:hypothetical protein
LAVGASLSACGGGSGVDVAHVGGSSIGKATLDHWSSIERGTSSSPRTSVQRALGLVISAQQTLAEAAELGVTGSDGRVHERLAEFEYARARGLPFELRTSFERLLDKPRETPQDRLWLVKLAVLATNVERVLLSRAERALGPADIRAYYAKNKRRFVLPEQRELEVLGNAERSVVVKAKREIQAGVPFLMVARRVSTDAEAPEGLQHLVPGMEEPAYERHVFSARPGTLVGPVRQAFYYIFKVIAVTPTRQLSLTKSEAKIRRQLVAARRGAIVAELRQRWVAKTSCRPGYVVVQCAGARSASP